MKMSDAEIIKALKCCREFSDCDGCQYGYLRTGNGLCIYTMQKDALDLINRLKAENERLETVIDDDEDEAVGLIKVTYCKDCKSSHFDSIGGICTIRKDLNDNPLKVARYGYCDAGKDKS